MCGAAFPQVAFERCAPSYHLSVDLLLDGPISTCRRARDLHLRRSGVAPSLPPTDVKTRGVRGQGRIERMQTTSLSDAQLVLASAADPTAFGQVFDRHARTVFSFASRRVGSEVAKGRDG